MPPNATPGRSRSLRFPVLGNRTRKAGAGLTTEVQVWDLSGVEKKDLQGIHADIAREELGFERKRGNLLNINRFVDNRLNLNEDQVKLGGKISYQDVADMADVMLFALQQLYLASPERTGSLKRSYDWILNSKLGSNRLLQVGEVPTLAFGDELFLTTNIEYAKYVEQGSRGRKGKFMFRKVVGRLKRRYGQAFIFEKAFLQGSDVPPSYSGKKNQRGGQAYSKEYYRKRWAVSFPAIKIKLKRNVAFIN